jgi:arsenate reductase (glutaredoxin)
MMFILALNGAQQRRSVFAAKMNFVSPFRARSRGQWLTNGDTKFIFGSTILLHSTGSAAEDEHHVPSWVHPLPPASTAAPKPEARPGMLAWAIIRFPAAPGASVVQPPDPTKIDVVIYHNPVCETSRNTLALIRNAGVEPHIIEYLKTPPSRDQLSRLRERMGLPLRDLLRHQLVAEHGIGNANLSDDILLDTIALHPILLNRPIVVTPWGVRLCRPAELVLDILPLPQRGAFAKENGECIIDADGVRVSVAQAASTEHRAPA